MSVSREGPKVSPFWVKNRPILIDMLAVGKTVTGMARILGCGKGAVAGQIRRLRISGIVPGEIKTGAHATNRRIDLPVEDEARFRALHAAGLTYPELAAEFGFSRDSAKRTTYRLGLDPRHSVIAWTGEMEATYRSMRAARKSFTAIGLALGISHSAVRAHADRLGIVRRLDKAPRKKVPSRPRPAKERPVAKERQKRAKVIRPPRAPKPQPVKLERPKVVQLTSYEAVLENLRAPAGTGVSFMDLRRFDCHWPLICDGGETRYCGDPAMEGSWCSHHAARVFKASGRPSAHRVAA